MGRRVLASLAGSMLLLAALLPSAVAARSPEAGQFTQDGIYVVQMADLPVVAYTGDTKGLKATAPRKGQKIDPTSTAVTAYADYLKGKHAGVLRKVGGSNRLYDYVYTYNGFAARLTAAQANKLAATKGVIAVSPDVTYTVDTSSTPDFLGLTAQGGLWDQLGGVRSAGENIIIGDIDTGIWPESLSFADRVDKHTGQPSHAPGAKLAYHQIPGWHGKCITGEAFSKTQDCNQKLIGAQWFDASFADPGAGLTGDEGLKATNPWEFASARDYNGHGTHTASTAGGNYDTPTTGPAAVFGPISGMAPRARIAMYKALWSSEDASEASGSTSDLVAAIDAAVADGVDVINYSISGTRTDFANPVEISFLFAADAGIFVAESAGNDGPTIGTVAHPSPWTTTVAAGTHNRDGQGSVTLGNGQTYEGASIATAVGPAPLINSTDAGLPGADPDEVRLCYSTVDTKTHDPVLDPAKIAGKIVVCERGVTPRVNKSLAVQAAGGVGMVFVNVGAGSLNADFHWVPTVHLPDADRAAIEAYAATPGATATINDATIVYDAPAPFTAAFSSRGPLAAGGGDLLKPDVIAPGQDILAAVAPPGNHGLNFNVYSGTSMSSPHVAGVAALLMDLHPGWSPMAVKSALMTTAYDVLDGGTPAPNDNPILIFRQGAGHIAPNTAADPGLVYDADFYDWLAFLCGTTSAVSPSTCAALQALGYSLDASDYNSASIAIGALTGTQTVTRRVTNVGDATATYDVSVTGMAGIDTVVSPTSLTLAKGETATYTVTFTEDTAALNTYTGGQLTWSDGTHDVRIPLVVKPLPIAAPAEVSGTADGISYQVVSGYDGTLGFAARGLVPAVTADANVAQDPDQTFDPKDPTGTYAMPFTVAADQSLLRVGIDEAYIANPGTDLDVFLYKVNADDTLSFVNLSAGPDSNEMVTVNSPPAGDYVVFVHGFNTAGPSTDFTLFEWQVPMTDAGNMVVPSPVPVTIAGTADVSLSFVPPDAAHSGVDPTQWYLGQVVYSDGSGDIGSTIVNVRPATP